jgi:uncharacterized protein YbbC (DUF1343 family)
MVRNGVDRIGEFAHLFEGKRLGLITSPTGLTRELEPTIHLLHQQFHLAALFAPEHGVRGDRAAGALFDHEIDPYTGMPVYSLYRQGSRRLTPEMLDAVDMIVYDIQDIGVRYYTFIYTMLYAMEDCAKAGKAFVILDRINPLDGMTVEGNVLKEEYRSFVGNYPLCVRYALTAGELARMANEQMGWQCRLHVVPCEGWDRSMHFPDTGNIWVPPSMGIPSYQTALLYPGTCLFEGTNISEGRGTTAPFEMIGAPFIDAEALAKEMNGMKLPGVLFRPVYFRPTFSKYQGELCRGVHVHITDPRAVRPVETGVKLLFTIQRNYEAFHFLPPARPGAKPFIDLLGGDKVYRDEDIDVSALLEQFREEAREFAKMKAEFHLY